MFMKVSSFPDTDWRNNTEGIQKGQLLMQGLFPAKCIKRP